MTCRPRLPTSTASGPACSAGHRQCAGWRNRCPRRQHDRRGCRYQGADGAAVVGVVAGDTNAALDNTATLGVQIQGLYGKLTLAADGTYTYTRDAGSAGGHDDVFTYTIKDGDGDTRTPR
ncbi:Ig-like domain-containing protein [Mesorhizobium sp. C268A]|uniref:Ig-like domain-containing protein n=1 Tax=Mesorhizobium sp. C268A TaxID=2956826 RepID=UPI00333587C8